MVKTRILITEYVEAMPITKYDHFGLIFIFFNMVKTNIVTETTEAPRAM